MLAGHYRSNNESSLKRPSSVNTIDREEIAHEPSRQNRNASDDCAFMTGQTLVVDGGSAML